MKERTTSSVRTEITVLLILEKALKQPNSSSPIIITISYD